MFITHLRIGEDSHEWSYTEAESRYVQEERMGSLILPTKKKWFYMVLSGEKKEEYRAIKPHYQSRFNKIFSMTPHTFIPVGNERRQIMFRNGYSRKSPSFIAECTLDIKQGKEEWGAEKGVEYYVLTVHKIIWRSMDNMGGYLKIAG